MKVIAEHPPSVAIGTDESWDVCCARCGGSTEWDNCDRCDDGYIDEHDDDPINFSPGEFVTCHVCHGHGGWNYCGNSPEWCEANPLPGRENVTRGRLEWFTVKERVP